MKLLLLHRLLKLLLLPKLLLLLTLLLPKQLLLMQPLLTLQLLRQLTQQLHLLKQSNIYYLKKADLRVGFFIGCPFPLSTSTSWITRYFFPEVA